MSEAMLTVGVLVLIGLFLLIRQFWTWYWKINQALSLLKGIHQELVATNQHLQRLQTRPAEVTPNAHQTDWPTPTFTG